MTARATSAAAPTKPLTQPRSYDTATAWQTEAARRFGADSALWRFVCPVCGHVASVADWTKAGAPEGAIAFACIGRYLPEAAAAFDGSKGPCNYTGGGLFKLNPITVKADDGGSAHRVFAFDETTVGGAL